MCANYTTLNMIIGFLGDYGFKKILEKLVSSFVRKKSKKVQKVTVRPDKKRSINSD